MVIENANAGFEMVGVIMTALGFRELCHAVDSRAVTVGTILLTVIGLLLMLLV